MRSIKRILPLLLSIPFLLSTSCSDEAQLAEQCETQSSCETTTETKTNWASAGGIGAGVVVLGALAGGGGSGGGGSSSSSSTDTPITITNNETVSFYLSNLSGTSIQNIFVSASESDDWGNDKLIVPTLGEGSIYIGEIDCNQSLDFRADFFPTTLGEHKKYNYYINCNDSNLTWTIQSTSQSIFSVN